MTKAFFAAWAAILLLPFALLAIGYESLCEKADIDPNDVWVFGFCYKCFENIFLWLAKTAGVT